MPLVVTACTMKQLSHASTRKEQFCIAFIDKNHRPLGNSIIVALKHFVPSLSCHILKVAVRKQPRTGAEGAMDQVWLTNLNS